MKKLLCILLAIMMLMLTSCAVQDAQFEHAGAHLIGDVKVNYKDEYSVRDFGTAANYFMVDGAFSVSIYYPETELPFLNSAISQWLEDTVEVYAEIARADGKNAELTASFDSYSVNENLVSVKIAGKYFAEGLKQPIEIVETFNADIANQKLLDNEDIISDESYAAFEAEAAGRVTLDEDKEVNMTYTEDIALLGDGIEVMLTTGRQLPEDMASAAVKLSYEELEGKLTEDFIALLYPPEEPEEPVNTIDPTKPMIAITFDDGPSDHTGRLLDILNKNGAKGTFFVVGYMLKGRDEQILRMHEEGHEIANHTWSHKNLTELSDAQIAEEITKVSDKIFDITGSEVLTVRPPLGAYNDKVKAVGARLGVKFVNWSVDTLDWQTRNADAVYEETMKFVNDGSIILCHDLHESTVDAMEKVIPALIEKGYQLVTVSELLSYSSEPVEAGEIYFFKK